MLSEYINQAFKEGKTEFANIIRTLVCQKDPALFESLEITDETIFAEPLLFSFFNTESPTMSLQQILFGYLEKNKRPNKLEIFIPSNGIIYLPQIGYLKTSLMKCYVQLLYSPSDDSIC